MTTVDGALWALAAVLLGAALIVQAGQERPWDASAFFAASLAALRTASGLSPVPLRGGPIPDDGWDGDVATLDDDLGPDLRVGPGLDWAGLGGPSALAAIERRMADVTLVWFEAPKVRVDGVRTEVFALDAFDAALALDALAPLVERPESRLVLAAHAYADPLLRLLAESPGLRDRLRAVLLVGSNLDPEWVSARFTHLAFDVEVQREIPYVTLRLPGASELRAPPPPPTARTSIAVVDLGEIELDALTDASTARALGALLAAIG